MDGLPRWPSSGREDFILLSTPRLIRQPRLFHKSKFVYKLARTYCIACRGRMEERVKLHDLIRIATDYRPPQ